MNDTTLSKTTRERLGAFYLILSVVLVSFNIWLDIVTEDPPFWYFLITGFLIIWFLFEIYMFVSTARQNGIYAGFEAVQRVG